MGDCSIEELAARISLEGLGGRRVILVLSPCRSGSTAMVRAFAALGVEAHHQPLKNLLRWCLLGKTHCWQAEKNGASPLLIKETLGPFSQAECRFDPLALLMKAGLPADQLSLLFLARTPLETWASWRHWWAGRTGVELFIESYHQVEALRQKARSLGVATHTRVYELFRDYPADQVMQELCGKLNIPYSERAVEGWQQLPRFSERGSGVVIPQMPTAFLTDNIRQRIEEGTGFRYFSRADELAQLPAEEIRQIEAAGIQAIYRRWCQVCEGEMGLAAGRDPVWI